MLYRIDIENMKHTFYTDPKGFFTTTYNGSVSLEENRFIVEKMIEMVNGRMEAGKKAYILVDLTNLGEIDPGSLIYNAKALKEIPVEHIAAVATNAAARTIIQTIINLSGESKKMRMFGSREEAERWLLEEMAV